MRVILTTGGTGGHVFPALAVAEALKRRFPKGEIIFVGGCYGREREWASSAGLEFRGLPVRGVMGRGFRAVAALGGLVKAVGMARGIIRDFRPDVVAGFGGYAALPSVAAARMAGIPVAVHEQNAVPGLANRILGRMACKICLSMPHAARGFDVRKTVLTGNPVRSAIAALGSMEWKKTFSKRRLLVLGGSLGARKLNNAVVAMLPALAEANVSIWHQTGPADFERVRAEYAGAGMPGEQVRVEPFISDMARAYAWADLALCRAGATTIAELTLAGVPAFFVPFPFATHNHQVFNARELVDKGAAFMIEERELDGMKPDEFAQKLFALLDTPAMLAHMACASRALAKPAAADDMVSVLVSLCRGVF